MATEPRIDDRPLRADARRNRERILEAGRVACAEHGAAVQMDDVARRAGVGVGTKDSLIEALVAEKIRVTTENLREALEIEDPWEAFAAGVRRNAEVMAADAALRDALRMRHCDRPQLAGLDQRGGVRRIGEGHLDIAGDRVGQHLAR